MDVQVPMLIGLGSFCTKADASCLWQWLGIHELLDCFDQGQYLLIVIRKLAFNFSDSTSKLSVTRDDLTQLDESPDNKDADIYSPGGVENGGRHNGAMLSECERKGLRELQLLEVVAICDHLNLLIGRELEHEVFRESLSITLNLLIQPTCRHAIKLCKVGINYDFNASNQQDALLDTAHFHDSLR